MPPPTSAATYERARRLANVSIWAIELQCRRLELSEPEDAIFIFRKWTAFDFLIVALTRLRRAAVLAVRVPQVQEAVSVALQEFDAALPGLKKLRDIAEHIDEYAVGRGRQRSVKRQELEVSQMSTDPPVLVWLGHELNARDALHAGQKLFRSIQEAAAAFSKDAH